MLHSEAVDIIRLINDLNVKPRWTGPSAIDDAARSVATVIPECPVDWATEWVASTARSGHQVSLAPLAAAWHRQLTDLVEKAGRRWPPEGLSRSQHEAWLALFRGLVVEGLTGDEAALTTDVALEVTHLRDELVGGAR